MMCWLLTNRQSEWQRLKKIERQTRWCLTDAARRARHIHAWPKTTCGSSDGAGVIICEVVLMLETYRYPKVGLHVRQVDVRFLADGVCSVDQRQDAGVLAYRDHLLPRHPHAGIGNDAVDDGHDLAVGESRSVGGGLYQSRDVFAEAEDDIGVGRRELEVERG